MTGGGSGIGRAVVERFAREGGDVAILDRNGAAAETVASAVREKGRRAVALAADITDPEGVEKAVNRAVEELGPLSVLINNAGAARAQTFSDSTPENWRADVELNLNGAYFVTRAAIPSMVKRGGGAIVCVATVNALVALAEPAYSAGKAGLLQFARQLAVEYGPHNIRANTIIPGSVRTPWWDDRLTREPKLLDALRRWYPVGRVGEAEDLAAAILFLASQEAAFITGTSLTVDGGLTAGMPQFTADIMSAV
ncbi:MAG: glucose 1-dehydrogenase [Rhizobiaceae bacterium]|nr:glucose 1-dehydrogenase [Rhizobiaceae bacterium]